MTEIVGDALPEDAWDADDPPALQLQQLVRRVQQVTGTRVRLSGDVHAVLDALEEITRIAARTRLWGDNLLRADLVLDDIVTVRERFG